MSKENDGKTTIVNALNQIILGYDIMGSWIDVQFLQFIYLWDTIHRRKLGSMYQFAAAKKNSVCRQVIWRWCGGRRVLGTVWFVHHLCGNFCTNRRFCWWKKNSITTTLRQIVSSAASSFSEAAERGVRSVSRLLRRKIRKRSTLCGVSRPIFKMWCAMAKTKCYIY